MLYGSWNGFIQSLDPCRSITPRVPTPACRPEVLAANKPIPDTAKRARPLATPVTYRRITTAENPASFLFRLVPSNVRRIRSPLLTLGAVKCRSDLTTSTNLVLFGEKLPKLSQFQKSPKLCSEPLPMTSTDLSNSVKHPVHFLGLRVRRAPLRRVPVAFLQFLPLAFCVWCWGFCLEINPTCGGPTVAGYCQPQDQTAENTAQLKFNFQNQPWPDVLNWFARQADLSLVINQVPPGDFTFSDTKAYSPAQAIDLLNSVLLTKDFTLVRKDKMLILLNTKEGIPYDLVPEKNVEQLKDCGKFELVTTTFMLEGRPLETVQTEIKPLLGALGRLLPLPATGRIMVTETAGRMQAIEALIQAIPKPEKPKPPAPTTDPPPQVLKTYQVTDLDLKSTTDVLSKAVGSIRATIDEPSNQIFIFATEAHHQNVQTILEQLRASPKPNDAKVETYRFNTDNPTSLVEQLKAIESSAIFQIDTASKRIIVVANELQQAKLKQAIQSIDGPEQTSLTLKSYPIVRSRQVEVTETIKQIVPGISITPRTDADSLLIIASAQEHQQLEQVMVQLEEAGVTSQSDTEQLSTFTLEHADATVTLALLKSLMPTAQINIDALNRRLLLIGTEDQKAKLGELLKQLDVPAQQRTIKLYEIAPNVYKQLTPLLVEFTPAAKVSYDPLSKRLQVIASAQEHQQLEQVMVQLEEAGVISQSNTEQLSTFTLEHADATATLALLKSLMPTAQINIDALNRRLLLIGTEDQKAKLGELLKQLDVPAQQRTIKLYEIAPNVYKQLTPLLVEFTPAAKASYDSLSQRLQIIAEEKEHLQIADLINSLQTRTEMAAKPSLKVFATTPDQKQRFTAILPTLADRFPGLQIVPETDAARLTVWATTEQQVELLELLDSLKVTETLDTQRVLAVYPATKGDPKLVHQMLIKLFPSLEIVLDEEANRIVVWATLTQQAQVQQAVQQLDASAQSGMKNSIRTYSINNLDSRVVLQSLESLVPNVTMNIDRSSDNLIVWGRDKDHEKLKSLIDQMLEGTENTDRSMQVYDVFDQDPQVLSKVIQQIVPQASIAAERGAKGIAVWASAKEHAAIKPAIEQLASLENRNDRILATVQTTHTGALNASRLLKGVAPEAAFFPSNDDRSLFAFATEREQEKIQSVIEQLEVRNGNSTVDILKTYDYSESILSAAKPLVSTQVSKARFTDTTNKDQWLVWASTEDHAVIQEILESLKQNLPAQTEQKLEIYTLERVAPNDAQTAITAIIGTVTYLTSTDSNQLRIWTDGDTHTQVAELLKQLEAQLEESVEVRPLEVYAIDRQTDVATVFLSLDTQLTAGASIVQNIERNALLVRATSQKQAEIKAAIEQFVTALPEKEERVPKVYKLKNISPQTAQQLLITLVPEATYAMDPTNNNIAATAFEKQHQKIDAAIQQIDVASDSKSITRAYPVPQGYAFAIRSSLAPIFPQAEISTDYTGSVLIIAAEEQQHVELDKIIKDVLDGSADDSETKVYSLATSNPANVLTIVKQMIPRAKGTFDQETKSVVMTASAEEHVRIADLLEKIEASGQDRTVVIYRLRNSSPRAVQEALTQTNPRATFTVDRTSGLLIATAAPEDHLLIKQTIDQLDTSEDEGLTTHAYSLTTADPKAAETALERLLPSVRFASDSKSGMLIATATQDQHKRIESVVSQLEADGADTPHARAIEIEGGNSERLYAMLGRMYRFDNQVRFTYESTSGTIMFIGPKKQEDAIMELVDQWNSVVSKEQPRSVKVYELAELDGDAVRESMDELFEEQSPKPALQVQWYTNKLIAVATPEQHVVIESTLKQIRGQERRLEVFTLSVNSPRTVEDAIDQLFVDLPVGGSPSINASPETQQLFIRATAPQLEEIGKLLLKLGEPNSVITGATSDSEVPTAKGAGNLRVLSAPQSRELLLKLKELWPQISPNPLKIVEPDNSEPDNSEPNNSPPNQRPENEQPPEALIPTSTAAPNTSPITTAIGTELADLDSLATHLKLEKLEQAKAKPDATLGPYSAITTRESSATKETMETQETVEIPGDDAMAPLLVIPSGDQLTIASRDLKALAVFEELFRILTEQESTERKIEITGNFTVFQLKNAGARDIGEMVSRLFQQITATQGSGSDRRFQRETQSRVSIVPDERLNALIVYGPPNDRRTIESLIKILDTNDIPLAANRGNQPRIVSVKNVEADRILDVLESIYRTQLKPDQPPRVQIPAGVSVEVAVALREINAEATAPLLTLEVDRATNSIIVLASERLGTEVESLIERLDLQNKESNTRSFKVIALENSNTQRIEKALQQMLRPRGGRNR